MFVPFMHIPFIKEYGCFDFFFVFVFFVVFFFQAEDGIRDIGVTGVQTCALPIFQASLEPSGSSGGLQASCAVPRRPTAYP